MKITRSQLRKLINEAYYGPDYEPTVDELKNHPDFQLAQGLFDFKGPSLSYVMIREFVEMFQV